MAWTEKLKSGRHRGGYRRPGSPAKLYVEGTFELKRDAKEAAQEAEVKARRDAAAAKGKLAGRVPWGEWWDLIAPYRETVSDSGVSELTIVDRYLRPQWGDTPLNEIEQPDVQAWVDALTAGTAKGWEHERAPSPKYVRNIYELFRVSISRAVKTGVLTTSPCAEIKLRRVPKKRLPYLTVEAAEAAPLREDFQDAVDFDLEVGLRPGELGGLHAASIDWKTGWLEVADVYVQRRKVIRPSPKDQDPRKVPLSAKALGILKRQLDGRDLKTGCGVPHSDGSDCNSVLVFLRVNGKPMTPKALGGAISRAKQKGGGYALRRGYGTRMGPHVSPFDLAAWMGHSSLDQTKDYVQETPEARTRALAALGEKQPLKAVEQHGAERGTDSDRTTPDETARKDNEDAG